MSMINKLSMQEKTVMNTVTRSNDQFFIVRDAQGFSSYNVKYYYIHDKNIKKLSDGKVVKQLKYQ